jgi:hypothetical protein
LEKLSREQGQSEQNRPATTHTAYARAGTGPRPAVPAPSPGSRLPRPPVPQGVSGAAASIRRSAVVRHARWPRGLVVPQINGRLVLLGVDVGSLGRRQARGVAYKRGRRFPPRTRPPCRAPSAARGVAGASCVPSKFPSRTAVHCPS